MPRPRNPQAYPMIYSTMIETVASTGEIFRHKCKDNKAAQHLRFSLYDYIKACKKSPSPRDQQIAESAAALMFTIDDSYLLIKPRDTEREVLALEETLRKFKEKQGITPQKPTLSNQPISHQTVTPPAGPTQDDLVNSFLKDKK